MKPKLLCVLHCSPPVHGAAKVGDFIVQSKKLQESFNCKFITIKSSETIGDIGKVNFKKIFLNMKLYMKILFALSSFRPNKIYFTASVKGIAFYRDILISILWKTYSLFKQVDIYYHYHTKGIEQFVIESPMRLFLTNFFIKNVYIILLSPLLCKDLNRINGYKEILFLPNGVEDNMENEKFSEYILKKYTSIETIHVLYLAHMMKDKGYWEVVELANNLSRQNIHFHFAGGWKDKKSKNEFFQYIKENKLGAKITYHGFVSGDEKKTLFKLVHLLLYPSKNDAFPLTILESLSYGVPILATNEGSIPFMLDNESGIVMTNLDQFLLIFNEAVEKFVNGNVVSYCRMRYLNNFTLDIFEDNLINIFKK